MQIKLAYKLFGAFFLILVIVAGAMLLSRQIFALTLKTFIRQTELENMARLVPDLQNYYRENGGWETIGKDSQQWRRLMMNRIPGMVPPPPKKPFPPNGNNQAPDGEAQSKEDPAEARPEERPGRPPERMMPEPPGGPPELFLMDAEKQTVVGRPGPTGTQQLVAIEVDGRLVGWLGMQQREPFKSGPPAEVFRRQATQLLLLSGVVIALTALVALFFARHLLRPIQQLIQGTRKLADLDFGVRITPSTKDELGQLAENFNVMAKTLENYEARQRQWLSDISHELRTPLSVLRGEIEALQDGVRDAGPESLTSLHAETLRISKLVEDLHLLSMADSDNLFMYKQWMSIFGLLDTLLKTFAPRFSQRHIRVEGELDGIREIHIRADADRLGQVFTNILENVFRYVESPGVLKISGQSDAHLLTLYFHDSGPGVPAAALPRLFDRLFRVDTSRNRESGGSGLGLSICRRIVESHNGRIWAQQSPMGGLTIGISLPLNH